MLSVVKHLAVATLRCAQHDMIAVPIFCVLIRCVSGRCVIAMIVIPVCTIAL